MHSGSDWGGSRLSLFQECHQKYYWHYEHGGSGLIVPTSPYKVIRGKAIHAALEYYYSGLSFGSNQITDHILASIQAGLAEADSHHFDDPNRLPLMRDEIISALDQYFQKYETEDLEPLLTEHPFSVRIWDEVHTGIIDLFGRWQGYEVVCDHKTTTLPLEKFIKSYHFDLSLRGYAYAMRQEGHSKCDALLNIIRFKENKALEVELHRELISYTDDDMTEFRETVQSIKSEIDSCRSRGFWPKSAKQCVQVWGECEYRRLCQFPDPAMENSFYVKRKP